LNLEEEDITVSDEKVILKVLIITFEADASEADRQGVIDLLTHHPQGLAPFVIEITTETLEMENQDAKE
jgi:hypothetical protein